ncbi:MAG: PAS domain S-box protein [Oscillatoriales cyanobacterium C42_A2020_001]|nr:PAS domain S-box protein [Leptolyngbyaceae cyanobacterium C42_A2020_001]
MVAVGVTAYLVYRNGEEALDDLANRVMIEISDRVEDSLENQLAAPVQITNSNAEALRLGILNRENPLAIHQYFWHQLSDTNNIHAPISAIALIDEEKSLLAVEKANTQEQLIHLPSPTKALQTSHFSTNSQTKNSAQNQVIERVSQYKLNESDFWYSLARQSENGIWKLTTSESVTDSPTLIASYWKPFYDSNSILRGVTGTSINLAQLGKYLKNLKIAQTGEAFVVERDGTVVATSTGEPLIFETPGQPEATPVINAPLPPSRQWRLLATRSLNSTTKSAAQFLIDHFGSFERISHPQQLSFDTEGNHYFLQVTPLKNPQNLNWFVVVVIPKSDFAAQIHRNQDAMLLLSGTAMLAAIALGLATSQLIAKPILRLSRASRDLMLGKLDAPVQDTTRIKELAVMAHSFNEMTEQLMQSFDQVKLALQESKEKYTTVFRTSPDPIIVSTLPDGKILEVNDSFLRLSGYSQEQVINRTAIELGLWNRLEEREEFLQLIQKTGRIYNQEVSAQTQYGTKLTVLISSEVIELEGKKCLLTVAKDITERKRLEEALKQSTTKLQDVLNSVTSSVCCFWVDLQGRLKYDYLSPSHYTLFGFAPEELLADPHLWQSRVHPDDRSKTFGIFPDQFVEGTFETEYRFYHKDGTLRWISDYLTFRWDSARNRWRVTSVALDISDRKQLETALRESEAKLTNILNSAAAAICYFHLDHTNTIHPEYYSQGVETVFGYPPNVLLKNHSIWQNRVHPDDWQTVIEPCLASIGHLRSMAVEYRYLHPDSSVHWIAADVISQWDSNQNRWLVTTVEFDITARKQTEAALHLSEELFRTTFDTATVGMIIASPSGQLLKVNSVFCQMLGYSEAELLQMNYSDVTRLDDLERDRAVNLLLAGETAHVNVEKRFICKDGRIVWTLLSLSLIRDLQQKPLYLIAQIQNITAQKQLEKDRLTLPRLKHL